MSIYNELKMKVFYSGNRINLFIGINVIIFLTFIVFKVFEYLFTKQTLYSDLANDYLAVPSNLKSLLYKPWTLFTYMFIHADFFHILFNMLWLYWIGKILEEYLNGKKITFLYIAGGLAGAVVYITCYNLFPAFAERAVISTAVGASGAVTAIIVATATLLPNHTISLLFLGPVRLVWIAIFYFIVDFVSLLGPNAGGSLAHIGGAIFGFLFIKSLQKGNDWSNPFEEFFKPKPTLKVVSTNYNAPQKAQKTSIPDQDEIDKILDKISQTGYNNLTKKEKEILFNASKSNEEK
jgi:membrane associated rhomboid family serine protease